MPVLDASVFAELQEISRLTRRPSQEAEGRDRLIRFLDLYGGATVELPIVDSLCARFGLYPYMSSAVTDGLTEALAVEYHTPAHLAEEGFTFHAMQQHVYQRLMDGESLILSAPTSFGKSAIIEALVSSDQWSNIVLIVPTIALIDETRRRMARYHSTFTIVTHPSQEFGARNILILTQERFLELEHLPNIDLFVIDEFYKLGSGKPQDSRRTLLNLAWNKLKSTGAQYYLIGPNIDSLGEGLDSELTDRLLTTNFKTVVVDVEDRSAVIDQLADLKSLVSSELSGQTLVFTGSPQKAENLGIELAADGRVQGLAAEVAEWIGQNYDPDWNVVKALSAGVGVHTGPMPRSLQRIMVRLFNEALIERLVCTTTLIEGVNTSAKNVVIFERKIDGQLLDFFTFSNIRGRAGRMFRHFVGHVVTYSPPPESSETEVDIPIETQSALASLATLIQLDAADLSEEAHARVAHVLQQDILSLETMRGNRGLNPERQIAVAEVLAEASATDLQPLVWTGAPTNAEARAVLELAFDELLEPSQRRGMNFNMLWGKLQNVRNNHDDFARMVDQQLRYARSDQSRSDIVTDVMSFQRNWMGFTIPSMLRGLQNIQAEVLSERGMSSGNFEFLLREVEALYTPGRLVELEEYGLPLPMAIKLAGLGLSGDEVPELIDSLLVVGQSARARSQLNTVEQWILDDVMTGLLGPQRA